MSINKETVLKIAALARLKVSDDELDALSIELSNILRWVEQLDEIDTSNVSPMASVIDTNAQPRKDKITDGDVQDKVLINAPDSRDGYFTVPKVIE